MLPSTFSVTTQAADLRLLTIAELRAAAGATDHSKDATLSALGVSVAALISKACRLATDGAIPPTLRQETLTDTFRLNRGNRRPDHQTNLELIYLSRRPVVSVTSIVEAGTTLASTDYEVRPSSGGLVRLSNDEPSRWLRDKITVVYAAGFSTVPTDLKLAASIFVALLSQGTRDPYQTFEHIDGVVQNRWQESSKDGIVPAQVMDILERGGYVNEMGT